MAYTILILPLAPAKARTGGRGQRRQRSVGTWWGYTGTITGQGQRPIVINGGQPITPIAALCSHGTGRIFNPTSTEEADGAQAPAIAAAAIRVHPPKPNCSPRLRRSDRGLHYQCSPNKASSSRTAQPNPSAACPRFVFRKRQPNHLNPKTPSRSTRQLYYVVVARKSPDTTTR